MNPLERAQSGLREIEAAISDLLTQERLGLTNSEITTALGLESDQNGKQPNYLAWSILGRMMATGTIVRMDLPKSEAAKARTVYRLR